MSPVGLTAVPVVVSLALVAAGPVCAASPQASDAREEAAVLLLQRASTATRSTAYQGTQFVSVWGRTGTTTVMARVVHLPGQGTAVTVNQTATAPGGTMFTTDDEPASPMSTPSGGALVLLARNYDLSIVGSGQVAGRDAYVVAARRDDGGEAARFWVDAQLGLLLRRQIVDSSGRIVRASAFLDLEALPDAEPLTHLPPRLPEPWGAQVSMADLTRLKRAGWTCPEALVDGLRLYDARRESAAGGTVLHLAYSDGLSTASLFVQRGRLDRPPKGYQATKIGESTVYVAEGVTSRVVWSADGSVYTLLADAPWETVEAVVSRLPREEERGWADRVGHGLSRVLSWFNPFG